MLLPEYDDADATEIAARIQSKDWKVEEVLQAAIERIDTRNVTLNAVVYRAFDEALADTKKRELRGPFAGVPFLLKDIGASWAGHPLSCGSRFLKNFVPRQDSHIVNRFRQAGLIFLGKTNTPEYGLMGVTEPALFGPCRNPWNTLHTPGGSSGGAAAAVAARMVPMAHGGDGGGSIRIPSSACGLFGFKPTRGRISFAPDGGESWSGFVNQHVLSRSVRDSAKMLDWLSGYVPGDPYVAPKPKRPFEVDASEPPPKLRIALCPEPLFGEDTSRECRYALEKAATIVCELGHQVDLARPIFGRESLIRSYFTIVSSHLAHEISSAARLNGRQPRFDELEPATWFLLQVGRSRSAEDLIAAREVIFREARTVALFFENYDVLMTPTLAAPPAKVGQFALSWWEQFGIEALKKVPVPSHRLEQLLLLLAKQTLNASPNTMLFNQTGQPAMSLPLAMSDSGLPIGIQFVGAYGRDDLLFQLAGQVERLASWAERRPEWLAY